MSQNHSSWAHFLPCQEWQKYHLLQATTDPGLPPPWVSWKYPVRTLSCTVFSFPPCNVYDNPVAIEIHLSQAFPARVSWHHLAVPIFQPHCSRTSGRLDPMPQVWARVHKQNLEQACNKPTRGKDHLLTAKSTPLKTGPLPTF